MADRTKEAANAPAKERMDWVDIIKATSVVLVVLLHVTQSLAFAVDGTAMAGFWNGVMTFLEPLRMPVFFIVSGILASSAVKRPWSLTKARTIGILYLYLLWHTVMTFFGVIVDLLTKGYIEGSIAETFATSAVQIFVTPGGYWYFYALVLYFVLAKLLRNLNPWLVLGVAASLNLARPMVNEFINTVLSPLGVSHMMPSVVMNAVYFLAGVYLVQFFKDYAVRNDTSMLVGTATVAILGSTARLLSPQVAAGSFLPIAIAWVLTAILVAVRLQRNEKVVAFGRYVGPRTLPIFVLQFLALDVMYTYLGTTGAPLLNGSPLLQFLYPIVVTLAITMGSLWVYDRAMQYRATRLLFKAPSSWTAPPAVVSVEQERVRAEETGPMNAVTGGSPDSLPGAPGAERTGTAAPDQGAAPAVDGQPAPGIPAERDHRSTGELPAIRT